MTPDESRLSYNKSRAAEISLTFNTRSETQPLHTSQSHLRPKEKKQCKKTTSFYLLSFTDPRIMTKINHVIYKIDGNM